MFFSFTLEVTTQACSAMEVHQAVVPLWSVNYACGLQYMVYIKWFCNIKKAPWFKRGSEAALFSSAHTFHKINHSLLHTPKKSVFASCHALSLDQYILSYVGQVAWLTLQVQREAQEMLGCREKSPILFPLEGGSVSLEAQRLSQLRGAVSSWVARLTCAGVMPHPPSHRNTMLFRVHFLPQHRVWWFLKTLGITIPQTKLVLCGH